MASIYDNIKTAKDLVAEVMRTGLSTSTEDICRAQDIFGRSSIDELDELANDIGRNNEYGEPDRNGSWSSGRKGTRGVFYQILYQIWNWEDATRFYNEHTNPDYIKMKEILEENDELRESVEHLTARRDELIGQEKKLSDLHIREFNLRCEEKLRADKLEIEVVKLKAMLFDLMTERKDKAESEEN